MMAHREPCRCKFRESRGADTTSSLRRATSQEVRLLVRPGSESKVVDLVTAGAKVITGSLDAGQEATLAAAVAHAHAVISTVQGGPDVILEGQQRLFSAARAAGVRRFVRE